MRGQALSSMHWEILDQTLSAQQVAQLPTDEDVEFYQQHGWYISQAVIPDAIIEQALAGAERFYLGERDAFLPVSQGYSDWQPGDGNHMVRNNEFVSLQSQALRQLTLQPIVGAIAAKLTGTHQIRLLDDQLICKPPQAQATQTTSVGWHTDRAYWANCTSDQLLTAWIPFHDCDVEMGPLVVIDGSHQWPGLDHLRGFRQTDLTTLSNQLQQLGIESSIQEVSLTLRKGQVSFHHCWTIHGSYPNRSQRSRLAIAVHLQDASNCYRPYKNDKGQAIHMFDEQLCQILPNGDPDFSDPNVFPELWSES